MPQVQLNQCYSVISQLLYSMFWPIKTSMLFGFYITLSTCVVISGCSSTSLCSLPLDVVILLSFDFPKCITWHLSGLNHICQNSIQVFNWSASCIIHLPETTFTLSTAAPIFSSSPIIPPAFTTKSQNECIMNQPYWWIPPNCLFFSPSVNFSFWKMLMTYWLTNLHNGWDWAMKVFWPSRKRWAYLRHYLTTKCMFPTRIARALNIEEVLSTYLKIKTMIMALRVCLYPCTIYIFLKAQMIAG